MSQKTVEVMHVISLGVCDGARTLIGIATKLEARAAEIRRMAAEGWVLDSRVIGDYADLRHPKHVKALTPKDARLMHEGIAPRSAFGACPVCQRASRPVKGG